MFTLGRRPTSCLSVSALRSRTRGLCPRGNRFLELCSEAMRTEHTNEKPSVSQLSYHEVASGLQLQTVLTAVKTAITTRSSTGFLHQDQPLDSSAARKAKLRTHGTRILAK